ARRRLGHPARLAEIARRERVLRVDDALARAVVGVLLEAGEAGAIDLLERPPHRARAIREPPRLPLVARARGLERALGRGAAPIDRATRELSLLGLEPRERVHRLGERALSLAEARLDEALLRPPERAG